MATGTVTTYGFTTGLMLDFEPLIVELDPFDVPILGGVGADGASVISKGTCFEKKVEWQDEDSLSPRTTLGAAYTAAATFITVASGERERFQTDDVVLIEAEYMLITGYGTTANTLTISAWSGTNANHASGKPIVGVGSAPVEGGDAVAARARDRTARYNLTEVFGPYQVAVSGTEQAVKKYGLSGTEFDLQVGRRIKEASIAQEQAIIYGARVDDTTNSRRTMGGLDYYITSNVDSTTTQLTETLFLDRLQAAFDAGGSPDRVTTGSKQKRIISAFTSSGVIQVIRADNERGVVVDTFNNDFGRVSIILDRWYRVSDLHIWNRDQASLETLRPLHYEPLAKTGDADKGMVVAEKTLRFRAAKHAAKFNALT